eukprot:gene7569-9694_t
MNGVVTDHWSIHDHERWIGGPLENVPLLTVSNGLTSRAEGVINAVGHVAQSTLLPASYGETYENAVGEKGPIDSGLASCSGGDGGTCRKSSGGHQLTQKHCEHNRMRCAGMTEALDNDAGATLLVVDDDLSIRSLLAFNLGTSGFRVLTAPNVSEMRRLLKQQHVDVLILDVMMPGEDGLSACRSLDRDGGPPVILLSALGEETDRILGLESGADRYLPKPCSYREILAHVRTVLRSRHGKDARPRNQFCFLDYRVDLGTHELFNQDGALIDLSEGEFAVLRAFVERPRRILSRNDLLLAARGPDSEAFARAIDVQISRLRRKLKSTNDSLIRTRPA